MQGRRGAADRVAERRLRVRPPVPAHRHLVSNGGEWYSGGSLEPLPKIHLGGTSWLDDNALSPLPGEWGYSPLDDYEPYASPYGADAADSLSGASTDGSRSVAQPSKCQTCEQALIASERLTTMMAIQCLWEAASREVDASGRPLTHGLSPSDPNRAGLLRKLRERCAATRRGTEEPSEPLGRLPELGERRTEAKEPKCDTCAQALAAADSLGTEAAIRCLWAAASRTSDNRGRPLTHGLYPADSDRKGLLDKLRRRCTPGAEIEEPPAKDDRRTTSVPLKPRPEDRRGWPPWGDAQNDLLPGRRSKLRYPPTARSCGQKKSANRFELQQAQERPWAQGWFPCPPDGGRLEENSEAYRWWNALPTWGDRGIADSQVAALQEALEDCVDSVRKRALEPVTTFRTMEDAHRLFPSVIEDIRREAAEWGTASLHNMKTLSISMLINVSWPLGTHYVPNLVGGEWFETMSRDQVVDEYERRADKLEGVTHLYVRPTYPGYQDALREAVAFVDGERAYDEALFEANYRYKALGKALMCRALYRLPDRAGIGNGADALLKGVLDDRHRALRGRIRGAETRYELGAVVCELGHRLCCALLRCRHFEAALKAIEAIEAFRSDTSGALRKGQAIGSFGLKELGCEAYEADDDLEQTASAVVSLANNEHDCSFMTAQGPMSWADMAAAIELLAEEVDLNLSDAQDLERQIKRRIGISEIFFFIADVAGYLAMALTVIEVGIAGWRLWVTRPPPKIPVGGPRLPTRPRPPEGPGVGRPSPKAPEAGRPTPTKATSAEEGAVGTGRTGVPAKPNKPQADKPSRRSGGPATFGRAPRLDYRKTFFEAHPELEGKVVVHHAVEQSVQTRYPGLKLTDAEMQSLENLRGIPKDLNSEFHLRTLRKEWTEWYKANPAPTKQDLLDFATHIDDKYGHLFVPPVRPTK